MFGLISYCLCPPWALKIHLGKLESLFIAIICRPIKSFIRIILLLFWNIDYYQCSTLYLANMFQNLRLQFYTTCKAPGRALISLLSFCNAGFCFMMSLNFCKFNRQRMIKKGNILKIKLSFSDLTHQKWRTKPSEWRILE